MQTNRMNQLFRSLSVIMALLLCTGLNGQNPFTSVKVVKNTTWSYEYDAAFSDITDQFRSDLGSSSDIYVGGGAWRLDIQADSTLGSDQVVVKYQAGTWPILITKYLAFDVDVVESIVTTTKDYIGVLQDSYDNDIDVLANDESTTSGLHISSIALVNNGFAEIIGNDIIRFTPEPGFAGMAYINYVACDDLGTCESGQVTVCVIEPGHEPVNDTVRYATTKNTEVTILLPGSDFTLSSPASHGSVDSVAMDVVLYTPDLDYSGQDTFQLSNPDSITRTVIVKVIYTPDVNGFAIDDYVYTTRNTGITFNVYQNDLSDFDIEDFSNPSGTLTHLGNGEFHYVPALDFEGLVKFDYTLCDFFNITCETAQVYIYVDDQEPMNDDVYRLVTPKNTPVILNYNVPVVSFDFEISQEPVDGGLLYYPGEQYVYIDCHEVYGYNQVVYDPDLDFVGSDEFELQYCVDNQDTCTAVRIEIIVLDIVPDTSCPCVQNCVWPGDSNNDGMVNVKDLLPVGWHMGANGPSRPEAGASEWYGQHCQNWDDEMADGQNLKYVDGNGDGNLLSEDTTQIIENYYQIHTVIPNSDDEIKSYPLDLIIEDIDVQTGDLATIYIAAGNETYPMIDYHGLALSIDYNVDVVDSGTLTCQGVSDNWLSINGPSLELDHIPFQGRLDFGLTRTDGISVSGGGIIAEINFIVGEEDLGGFGSSTASEYREYEFTVGDIYAQRADGEVVRIPGSSATLRVRNTPKDAEEEIASTLADLKLFPNPTSDRFRLHLNGSDVMTDVEIYSLTGALVHADQGLAAEQHAVDISGLASGMYVVRVTTGTSILTQKLQIVR